MAYQLPAVHALLLKRSSLTFPPHSLSSLACWGTWIPAFQPRILLRTLRLPSPPANPTVDREPAITDSGTHLQSAAPARAGTCPTRHPLLRIQYGHGQKLGPFCLQSGLLSLLTSHLDLRNWLSVTKQDKRFPWNVLSGGRPLNRTLLWGHQKTRSVLLSWDRRSRASLDVRRWLLAVLSGLGVGTV